MSEFYPITDSSGETTHSGHAGAIREMGKTAVKTEKAPSLEAEIIDLGLLSDIEWPGPVSARKMIEAGEVTDAKIKESIRRLNEFYVPVNPNAKTRCIDGRQDPELDEENLGPQVPGGAPGAALAYRLGVDKDDLTRGTFLTDAETMINTFLRQGFAPGGHRDEQHSDDNHMVGCGAIDGMDKVLGAMTDPTLVDDHKRVVKTLLADQFNRDDYLRVMGAGVVVNGRSEEYFRDREKILDILEKKSKNSVSTLKGIHKEALWVVNLVPGETLSSNRFADENGFDAFGYDLWRSKQMAGILLPLPNQSVDKGRFITARVMSTVATMMALTDGSQRLALRVPVAIQ